ncbi:hypothetical protein KBX26_15275 [Micromonospora sp. C97]|uniref:hypothetical protein n=1 Tax=Micromonospora sp. C97 TaxID=2824883 RepID=UPI001B37944C|nr:hypothetical protein [Micromonospora sp. C97]MBQ1031354.1 hypothetical protein [Micromonospora sp. C97]
MALTETFAATAAQTIPVFALAITIEARFVIRSFNRIRVASPERLGWREVHLALRHFVTYALWVFLMGWLCVAEWFSLLRLRGLPIPPSAGATVANAMLFSLILLALMPVLAWPLSAQERFIDWAVRRLRKDYSRENVGKVERTPPTLDDHPCMSGVEDHSHQSALERLPGAIHAWITGNLSLREAYWWMTKGSG